MIDYQGDRLSGIIKIQNKIDHNAQAANKEMNEAHNYESRHLQRVCMFTVILILIGLIVGGICLFKLVN